MRAAGDAVDVALQYVPTHLVIEGITELVWDLQKRQGDQLGPPPPRGCTEIALITAASIQTDPLPRDRKRMYMYNSITRASGSLM